MRSARVFGEGRTNERPREDCWIFSSLNLLQNSSVFSKFWREKNFAFHRQVTNEKQTNERNMTRTTTRKANGGGDTVKYSIIVPTYNEQLNIAMLLALIVEAMEEGTKRKEEKYPRRRQLRRTKSSSWTTTRKTKRNKPFKSYKRLKNIGTFCV